MIKDLLDRFRALDTIEKKSFWSVAPTMTLCGVVAIIATSFLYESNIASYIVGLLCIFIPCLLMHLARKSGNYSFYYPMLCFLVGGLAVPVTFIANGGFQSGMPIFCVAATEICSFCYEKKWRIATFVVCIVMTFVSFLVCYQGFDTFFSVPPENVNFDIALSYVMASICIFVVLNMLIEETRVYVINTEVLGSYVTDGIKDELKESNKKGLAKVEGKNVNVSVLFADISGFTTTSESMTPAMAADYINVFLNVADTCIHANGGYVDKFIGDCVMAYWTDKKGDGSCVKDAVNTVFDMREKLYSMSDEIYTKFNAELDFSAGIEYGDVIIGNIGSDKRKDYTIIGDAVNTASRIQGQASRGELLISGRASAFLEDKYEREIVNEDFHLRGKQKSISLHSVKQRGQNQIFEKEETAIAENYTLYVCGTRGGFPVSGIRFSAFGGETSCYIIKKDDYALVIDCGTGLKNAKSILSGCKNIDLLFTHVHYDHILGLLDMSVFPKNANMHMYGFFGGWAGVDTISNFLYAPYWPGELTGVETIDVCLGLDYELPEGINATFYKSDHPNNGCVIKLKVGNSKLCFFSDVENPYLLDPEVAMYSDILFFDGMYDENDKESHKGSGHSNWQQGIRYAYSEKVDRLIIVHHNPQFTDHQLIEMEKEAKGKFENVVFARAGHKYILS